MKRFLDVQAKAHEEAAHYLSGFVFNQDAQREAETHRRMAKVFRQAAAEESE